MLSGEMKMKDFVRKMETEKDLQDYIREMIPKEVLTCPEHPILKVPGYPLLERHNYDLFEALHGYRFNDSLGDNLNIYTTLESYYCYYFPETQCTEAYIDDFRLYLDIAGDIYDGEEVREDIQRIVSECRNIVGKGKKKAFSRLLLKEAFHVEKGHRPYWIQEAEWPRGEKSPMKYVGSRRIPDGKVFIFTDFDTGAVREVEQYY